MILTATPLRVSLFGGGSDYPEFFMSSPSGGAVLGMAINKYVYVAVQDMHPGQDSRYRVQYSKVDDCQTVVEIKHPAVKAILQYYGIDTPLEFHCFGDMPGRAGLGSSSAFCVGTLKALQLHFNLPTTGSPLDLASEAIAFERHIIPETVGFQDQIFAAAGGMNFIEFGPRGSKIQRLALPVERLLELEQSLVLVYSGSMRDDHKMADKQVAAIPNKSTAISNLTSLAQQGKEILLDTKQPLSHLGNLLHEAWVSKRDICPEVTTPDIDALYMKGLSLGADGGKLLGAGGGGFFLFFVPPERRAFFEHQIGSLCFPFQIAHLGSRVVQLNETKL